MRCGGKPGSTGNVVPLDETTLPPDVNSADAECLDLPDSSEYQQNVLFYISGWLIHQGKKSNLCCICVEAMTSNGSGHQAARFTNLKNVGGLCYPDTDVLVLLGICEKLIKCGCKLSNIFFIVMKKYGREATLFPSTQDHFRESNDGINSHYYSLIRFIVESFFNLRMHKICKNANTSVLTHRQKLTKLITYLNE